MADRIASRNPDYGLDAPKLVHSFVVAGCVLLVVGVALAFVSTGWLATVGNIAWPFGVVFLIEAALMTWSSRYGKLRARDRLLDGLGLTGGEHLLDVGCGRGLLLIGAARRLPDGRAVGIDLWSQVDLSDNNASATLANAAAEGVRDRIDVHAGDMRELPFPDAGFDAVVANLSIHNIYSVEGRREAIMEIVRVLKPGGQVALMDIRHVREYAAGLREAGMNEVEVSGLSFWIFPPVRTVTAGKPRK
ncbi:MAG: class I SAM-dependent methyltransferase [Gemmatimonadaceae bacterium]